MSRTFVTMMVHHRTTRSLLLFETIYSVQSRHRPATHIASTTQPFIFVATTHVVMNRRMIVIQMKIDGCIATNVHPIMLPVAFGIMIDFGVLTKYIDLQHHRKLEKRNQKQETH